MKKNTTVAPEKQQDNVYYLFGPPEPCPIRIETRGSAEWAYVRYTGAKEDLIEAGIATEDMFPQGRKRVIYHCNRDLPVNERFTTQRLKGGAFCVERPAAFQPDNLIIEPEPPATPWNPQGFRCEIGNAAIWATDYLLSRCQNDETHRYSDEAMEWIVYLKTELLRVLWNGEVEPVQRRGFRVIEGGRA